MTTSMTAFVAALLLFNLVVLLGCFALLESRAKRMESLIRSLFSNTTDHLDDIQRSIKGVYVSLDTVALGVAQCVPHDNENRSLIDTAAIQRVHRKYPNAIKSDRDTDLSEGIDVELRERFDRLCDHLGVRVHRPSERFKVTEYPKAQTDACGQATPG